MNLALMCSCITFLYVRNSSWNILHKNNKPTVILHNTEHLWSHLLATWSMGHFFEVTGWKTASFIHGCVCVFALTSVSAWPVQTGESDVVFTSVCPVDAVINKVKRQTIRPCDLILYDDVTVSAVHANAANMRHVTPVWPV